MALESRLRFGHQQRDRASCCQQLDAAMPAEQVMADARLRHKLWHPV